MEPFDTGNKQSVYFIVKNVSSIKRVIKIFNTKIGPGQQLDLMAIPGVTEDDIRTSLLKGPLNQLINNKTIQVVSSTVNLTSPDSTFAQFLNSNNAYGGLATNPGALTQADWYIDWINGNDNNPGTSALPVKTVMNGVVAKWGTRSPILSQSTTLHILNSQPLNAEYVVLEPVMVGTAIFSIIGVPTTTGTATLSGVVQKNRATGQLLNANLGSTLAVGTLVQNTTHASKAWAHAQLGGNLAAMTQPLGAQTIPYSPTEVDTWANGDTVNILSLPALNLRVFSPKGGDGNSIHIIQNVRVLDESGTPNTSNFFLDHDTYMVWLYECQVEPALWVNYSNVFATNCFLEGSITAYTQCGFIGGESLHGGALYVQCIFDGDIIIDDFFSDESNGTYYSTVYFKSGKGILKYGGTAAVSALYIGTCALWGPGGIYLQNGGALLLGSVTATSVLLLTGPMEFDDNATTGCSISAAGVLTGSVTFNAANIDASPNNIVYTKTWSRVCKL